MDIDERIETLTQSVELLSHMHQDNEKEDAVQFQKLIESLGKLTGIAEQLTTIAETHERRLRDLESGDA